MKKDKIYIRQNIISVMINYFLVAALGVGSAILVIIGIGGLRDKIRKMKAPTYNVEKQRDVGMTENEMRYTETAVKPEIKDIPNERRMTRVSINAAEIDSLPRVKEYKPD
ncbi:MAG: hypothetical protein U9P44_01815, partial [archaeon]|nr:hypothetical protein [archaeon]